MSRVSPMFAFTTLAMSYDFEVLAKHLEESAYDDTTAEECADYLHAASLASQLATTVRRLQEWSEEKRHAR